MLTKEDLNISSSGPLRQRSEAGRFRWLQRRRRWPGGRSEDLPAGVPPLPVWLWGHLSAFRRDRLLHPHSRSVGDPPPKNVRPRRLEPPVCLWQTCTWRRWGVSWGVRTTWSPAWADTSSRALWPLFTITSNTPTTSVRSTAEDLNRQTFPAAERVFSPSVNDGRRAVPCAYSYFLFKPEDEVMKQNLLYYEAYSQEWGLQPQHFTARTVTKTRLSKIY